MPNNYFSTLESPKFQRGYRYYKLGARFFVHKVKHFQIGDVIVLPEDVKPPGKSKRVYARNKAELEEMLNANSR